MIKVSVVIPVYNVEEYLCRCVDSVLAQNLSDLEIILVDDIMTTGATLHFCSEALQKAGAKKITAVVIASGRK